MTISRGQMPRQMYGLGSFVKSIGKGVKKAVGGVKDLVKSDFGKAALLGAGIFGLPTAAGQNLFSGFKALAPLKSGITSLFTTGIDKLKVPTGEKPSFGQFATVFGLGSLGGAALQALEASGAEEGDITDIDALRSYMRQGYKQLNPKASPEDVEAFIEQNTVEYRANGGRIGYNQGTGDPTYTGNNLEDLPRGLQIDTTTRNPIPEDALPKEIEMISKIMMGPGIAGMGEPEDGTMKGYQFFKDQFLPKKVKELSENFGYSEDEIYKMINTRVREYMGNPGKPLMAMGGRIKYANGSEDYEDRFMKLVGELMEAGFSQQEAIEEAREQLGRKLAKGGRVEYAMGSPEENAMQASGIMGIPLNQNPAGITELDLRETGGFIPPVGVKEKADDIPAMLSNNEFVFTADAVRGMGEGDVNKGAQRMYDMMKKLENGGRV